MSLRSAPYYWVECNNCGERCEYDDFSAMSTPGQAVGLAVDADWSEQGERHHCPECPTIADCEKCGKDAGELPLERDGLCRSCWDEAEKAEATA